MAVITKNESLKYCEAEGSYSRMWHSVPCFWVHGEWLDFYGIMAADLKSNTNCFRSILNNAGMQPLPTYEKKGKAVFWGWS